MFLDEILAAQKRGEARGIASICSAHPAVLRLSLKALDHPLIEATCNQVNQYGGYTGMTPQDFAAFVRRMAAENSAKFDTILLGGDHLGPHVWQAEAASEAMAKARVMVAGYVAAGFTKIHLDCSMRLGDDPRGALDREAAARRAAELARVAEDTAREPLHYVIGTEVPRPGGSTVHEEGVAVTRVEDTRETIEAHRKAFHQASLDEAWRRVLAVVVQPGVEFGDDFVLEYRPEEARALSRFIEEQPMVYEAHSTDYQAREALKEMVRDHFAILKVGPALTFAYREAIFALARIEDEWHAADQRSNVIQVLEEAMTTQPKYWEEYYQGSEREQAFKRKFSLSDRVRYYWAQPEVQRAVGKLMENLGSKVLPYSLSSQFLGEPNLTAGQAINLRIEKVLKDYRAACGESA